MANNLNSSHPERDRKVSCHDPRRRTSYLVMADLLTVCALVLSLLLVSMLQASEPPAINPFGSIKTEREDSVPGFAELSDKTVYVGKVYLTRDTRLKIYDDKLRRQREVPLRVISRIQCDIQKEWMEREWRFKENANNEKMYTGREYPAREYVHTITLHDGRQIRGPLSGIVYVQQDLESKPHRQLMHKRQKGPIGSQLKTLVYLRSVELGDEAYERGKRRSEQPYRNKAKTKGRQGKRK